MLELLTAKGLLPNDVDIGDVIARATDVRISSQSARSTTIMLTLHEGRNHQVRRMFEALGHRVSRLVRVSFAGLEIEGLKPGSFRRLTGRELGRLKRLYGTPHRRAKRAQRQLPSA